MIKVLIVDDEKNIREGIQFLIDWKALGCEVVASSVNGLAALQYVRENDVDIVVTDIKMPVMDGLELSRHLCEEYPDIKIIILTAYSEFSMAKEAIKYRVTEFIVKNDFMDELPKAIEKNVLLLKENESKVADKAADADDESYFLSILKSLVTDAEPSENDKSRFADQNFCICACEVTRYEDDRAEERNVTDMFENILKIGLKNCRYTTIQVNENLLAIGLSYKKGEGMNLNRIVEYFSNILIMVEEFMRIQVKLGISGEIADISGLREGFSEAKDALSKIDGDGCSLKLYDFKPKEENGTFLDVDGYLERICELTFDEKSDNGTDILIEFIDKLKETDCSFEQCKLYALVIYATLIHKAVRYQLNVELDFNAYEKELYKRVQNANTILSLEEIGIEEIEKIRALCIGKKNYKNELVMKVDECIKNGYKDELTLQVISNAIYLNASYVSRAYKKMTGNTVTEAITIYRVAKSKELLKTTNMKIYEIAENVGFKDAAYFTNVFYKYANENPSDYRLNHI